MDDYRLKLESAYLPPSRIMLKENIKQRFDYFKCLGISNIKALIQILKKKDKFNELQKVDCLSGEYLTILLRELNSTLPKPNKIAEFAGISRETVFKLHQAGIKDTLILFDHVKNKVYRHELLKKTGIAEGEIIELAKLTDLSRIKWVGVTYARILYELGVDTVEKVCHAEPIDLHEKINRTLKEKNIYKGHIGLNDVRILIDAAKEVPIEIEF